MISNRSAISDSVEVWLAFYHEIVDPALLGRLSRLLSSTERQKQTCFHFADDRKRYCVSRALLRTTLSRYAPVAPTDWMFETNAYGSPRIADVHADAAGITFNLSHTRGLIALAVTSGRAVGIDVENLTLRDISTGIADRFFARSEIDDLASIEPAQQKDRFFEYWTLKESYIKARGIGLSIPLDQFSFRFSHESTVALAVQPELGDDAARWNFVQYRPTPDYLLALCVELLGQSRVMPEVRIRKVVPTVEQQNVDLALKASRAS